MQATVRLFASAQAAAGRAECTLDLPEPAVVADLRRRLGEELPTLATLLPLSLFAVNMRYAAETDPIRPDDEIALIPPVSGG